MVLPCYARDRSMYGIATEIAPFAMVGLGFNLLGYTGLLSGHGLFFGFAAYATALAQIHWSGIACCCRSRSACFQPACLALRWLPGLRRGAHFAHTASRR